MIDKRFFMAEYKNYFLICTSISVRINWRWPILLRKVCYIVFILQRLLF